MTNAAKAMLWSGLIFPGLGQLVLKYYLRGIALALATCVCLYVLIDRAMQQAWDIANKIDLSSGTVDASAILAAVNEAGRTPDSATMRLVMWAMLILWLIGVVDAYIVGKKKDRQDGPG
jgi:hypothetical protein